MNFFFIKILNKIRVYYYYLVNKNSRKYFFILIYRKISIFINRHKHSNKLKFSITKQCENKKILDLNFYRKIGLNNPKDFFKEEKSYYLSAKLKEKNLSYKMGGMAHLNLIYNLVKYYKPKKYLKQELLSGGLP